MSSKAGILTCTSAGLCWEVPASRQSPLERPDDLCNAQMTSARRRTKTSKLSERLPFRTTWNPRIRRLTCPLVGLDFLQARQSPQGSAFFEGHDRHRVLISQHQRRGLRPHRQPGGIFYGPTVHRLCVFFWLGIVWQGLRWFRSLRGKRMNLFSRGPAVWFQQQSWYLSVDYRYASREPRGDVVFRNRTVDFTVSAESVLLVLRMISSSRCKRKRLLWKPVVPR